MIGYIQAENVVGVRESSPALLQVVSPPVLVQPPQDLSVKEGEDATLRCQVVFSIFYPHKM